MEKISIGEEVDHSYLSSVLKAGIEMWNECIRRVSKKLEEPQWVLQQLDDCEGDIGEAELNAALEATKQRMAELKEIQLSETSEAFRP